jgi:hypothetical protein
MPGFLSNPTASAVTLTENEGFTAAHNEYATDRVLVKLSDRTGYTFLMENETLPGANGERSVAYLMASPS